MASRFLTVDQDCRAECGHWFSYPGGCTNTLPGCLWFTATGAIRLIGFICMLIVGIVSG